LATTYRVPGAVLTERAHSVPLDHAKPDGEKFTVFTRGAMGSAVVGKPAPDFTALTVDRKPFQLSSVLGKKPIAIYFAAFDG
jgi:hypothetical protein